MDGEPSELMARFYDSIAEENLEWIKIKNQANKVYQSIKEKYSDRWEIVELCREALWDNARAILDLTHEIEYARKEAKRYRKKAGETQ